MVQKIWYVALSSATQETIWLRRLLDDIGAPQWNPTIIRDDDQEAIAIAKKPVAHGRKKEHWHSSSFCARSHFKYSNWSDILWKWKYAWYINQIFTLNVGRKTAQFNRVNVQLVIFVMCLVCLQTFCRMWGQDMFHSFHVCCIVDAQ